MAAYKVIMSRHLAQGVKCRELESAWCGLVKADCAATVSSGLSALRLGLIALGIGAKDEVIIPAYSCVALTNAVLAVRAIPVFADIKPDDWTIDPDAVAKRITARTEAIVGVHLFGARADIPTLNVFGIPVIEDCAHGPYLMQGKVSITSFYATKMIVAGEGGMVASNNSRIIDRVRQFRDYGDQEPDGRKLNDKMTDMEAAIVLQQLRKFTEINDLRALVSARYDMLLEPLQESGLIKLPAKSQYRYRYVIQLQRHYAKAVVARMKTCGVYAEQPVWDLRGCKYWRDDLPVSEVAFDRLVSLPLYPDLTNEEQDRVCDTFRKALTDEC